MFLLTPIHRPAYAGPAEVIAKLRKSESDSATLDWEDLAENEASDVGLEAIQRLSDWKVSSL